MDGVLTSPFLFSALPRLQPGFCCFWGALFMRCPLARGQTFHQGVNLTLGPCHSTGSEFHRAGEHSLAHEVEETAPLVAYTVKDFRKTDKPVMGKTGRLLFLLSICLHKVSFLPAIGRIRPMEDYDGDCLAQYRGGQSIRTMRLSWGQLFVLGEDTG